MKKGIKVLSIVLVIFSLTACSLMKKTAKGAVEDYLNQYKDLSANVLSEMESVLNEENLSDTQKEVYRDALKKQYADLKYEIISESYDGDTATVEVKITVYDLYKVQKDADKYASEHIDEFRDNGVYNADLFMDYKLKQMKETKDTVDYTVTFNLDKNEKGNYQVINVSNETLEKIHGIYNYDND